MGTAGSIFLSSELSGDARITQAFRDFEKECISRNLTTNEIYDLLNTKYDFLLTGEERKNPKGQKARLRKLFHQNINNNSASSNRQAMTPGTPGKSSLHPSGTSSEPSSLHAPSLQIPNNTSSKLTSSSYHSTNKNNATSTNKSHSKESRSLRRKSSIGDVSTTGSTSSSYTTYNSIKMKKTVVSASSDNIRLRRDAVVRHNNVILSKVVDHLHAAAKPVTKKPPIPSRFAVPITHPAKSTRHHNTNANNIANNAITSASDATRKGEQEFSVSLEEQSQCSEDSVTVLEGLSLISNVHADTDEQDQDHNNHDEHDMDPHNTDRDHIHRRSDTEVDSDEEEEEDSEDEEDDKLKDQDICTALISLPANLKRQPVEVCNPSGRRASTYDNAILPSWLYECKLCMRKFGSLELLETHLSYSQLHAKSVQQRVDIYTKAYAEADQLGKLLRKAAQHFRGVYETKKQFLEGRISLEKMHWQRAIGKVLLQFTATQMDKIMEDLIVAETVNHHLSPQPNNAADAAAVTNHHGAVGRTMPRQTQNTQTLWLFTTSRFFWRTKTRFHVHALLHRTSTTATTSTTGNNSSMQKNKGVSEHDRLEIICVLLPELLSPTTHDTTATATTTTTNTTNSNGIVARHFWLACAPLTVLYNQHHASTANSSGGAIATATISTAANNNVMIANNTMSTTATTAAANDGNSRSGSSASNSGGYGEDDSAVLLARFALQHIAMDYLAVQTAQKSAVDALFFDEARLYQSFLQYSSSASSANNNKDADDDDDAYDDNNAARNSNKYNSDNANSSGKNTRMRWKTPLLPTDASAVAVVKNTSPAQVDALLQAAAQHHHCLTTISNLNYNHNHTSNNNNNNNNANSADHHQQQQQQPFQFFAYEDRQRLMQEKLVAVLAAQEEVHMAVQQAASFAARIGSAISTLNTSNTTMNTTNTITNANC